MSTLAMIHTGPVVIDPLNKLASRILGGVKLLNFLDDSIVPELSRKGGLTASVERRVLRLGLNSIDAGADAILVTCSSISMLAEKIAPFVDKPVFKIDEAMAEKAVNLGKQIGVIATLATTLEPTCDLIEKKAKAFGKDVSISRKLCGDAFDRLTQGDREGHDELIMNAVRELDSDHDVIVLAQASMARLVETIDDIQVPVLSSPESGLEWVRKKLISHGLAE